VFFVKLLRILTGIFIFLLIFQLLQRLSRGKTTAHKVNQGDNGDSRRKFVESQVVGNPQQTDEEVES